MSQNSLQERSLSGKVKIVDMSTKLYIVAPKQLIRGRSNFKLGVGVSSFENNSTMVSAVMGRIVLFVIFRLVQPSTYYNDKNSITLKKWIHM